MRGDGKSVQGDLKGDDVEVVNKSLQNSMMGSDKEVQIEAEHNDKSVQPSSLGK